jgi:hypothetical protein
MAAAPRKYRDALAPLGSLPAADEDARRHPWARLQSGSLLRRSLFFEEDLHPIGRVHLDEPVGPVLARPLEGYLESQSGSLAGSDRGVHVTDAELPGDAGAWWVGVGVAAEPELDSLVADRDEARVFGTLVRRVQAQLLVETPFRVRILDMQDGHELGDQIAH